MKGNHTGSLRVLLVVDVQNTFMPYDATIAGTGELPVDGAPAVVPVINRLLKSPLFHRRIATKDSHPADHGSFYTMHPGNKTGDVVDLFGLPQMLFNPHGRLKTPGWEFYPALASTLLDKVVLKGMDKTVDSFSGFWDNGKRKSTGLADYLRCQAKLLGFSSIEVFVTGITRPFCPSWTALDAVDEGFETFLILDACSVLELNAGAGEEDVARLTAKGVRIIYSADALVGTCANLR